MDTKEEESLDSEYNRYLEIVRIYLDQILDKNTSEICNDWIQLCDSHLNEKSLRNKYISCLCDQISRGILEEPFTCKPVFDVLPPLIQNVSHDDSSTEMEYLLVDLDIKSVTNNKASYTSTADNYPKEIDAKKLNTQKLIAKEKLKHETKINGSSHELTCNHNKSLLHSNICSCDFKMRVLNILEKIRNIRQQNITLQEEVERLHKESKMGKSNDSIDKGLKTDTSTSTCIQSVDSLPTVKSLKCKIEELQASRDMLLENINSLNDTLNNYDDMKKYEIGDVKAKHKLEVMQVQTDLREELKAYYENIIIESKKETEVHFISKLEEIRDILKKKDALISEKDAIIDTRNEENTRLKTDIIDLRQNTNLGQCLNCLHKSKNRYCKVYEDKIYRLKKEKNLMECSFQLQLMKNRTKIVNESIDDHQKELATALEKLENKYKDIVANVQATAVQRKFLDQMKIELLVQQVCGSRKENTLNKHPLNQSIYKQLHSQMKANGDNAADRMHDKLMGNKVGSVIVGKKYSGTSEYLTDADKLVKLFEKLHIPQRDSNGT